MKTAWIDLRNLGADDQKRLISTAAKAGIDGIIFESPLPESSGSEAPRKVFFPHEGNNTLEHVAADVIVSRINDGNFSLLDNGHPDGNTDRALFVDVKDSKTLRIACDAVRLGWITVISFQDPTKIPLEIVLASADNPEARVITFVRDIQEARVVMSVLESGPHGVIMPARSQEEIHALAEVCNATTQKLAMEEMEVKQIRHIGAGERVCVDTCSRLFEDEGLLVGSFSNGLLLCCSETHPLPYMPTRPFRINAGALQSYVLAGPNRTNYLSELSAGSEVLAVNTKGEARTVVVGRAKIERRPLLLIEAEAPSGRRATLAVQDDWHVRVLGPGNSVLNVTELAPGTRVLGHLTAQARHVGLPVNEFCIEQ